MLKCRDCGAEHTEAMVARYDGPDSPRCHRCKRYNAVLWYYGTKGEPALRQWCPIHKCWDCGEIATTG